MDMLIFATRSAGSLFIWCWSPWHSSWPREGSRPSRFALRSDIYFYPPPSPSPFLPTIISKANSSSTIVRLHLNLVFTWHLHTGNAGQLSHSRTGSRPAGIVFDLHATLSNTDPETARWCLEKVLVLLVFILMPELVLYQGAGIRVSSVFPVNISLNRTGHTGFTDTTLPLFKSSSHTAPVFILKQI